MERYAAVVTSKDAEAYAALFTPDAVQMDPYPSGLHTGRDEIRAFIQSGFDGCETMTFEVEEVHPVADKAAIRFQITLAWPAAPPCTSGVSRSSPSPTTGSSARWRPTGAKRT